MKEKIFLFIIGLLVGAVITTGICYIYTKANSNECSNEKTQQNGNQPPEMPSEGPTDKGGWEMPEGGNGQPPEKPSENNN